jgi:hypothetical protein
MTAQVTTDGQDLNCLARTSVICIGIQSVI